MGKSILSPKAIFVFLLLLLPLSVFAQASLDELLDGYVSASVNGESTMPYATKINQLFKNYSKGQQTALRTRIYDRIVGDSIVEQSQVNGTFALIDLYSMLADSDDQRMDDLSFKKGEVCALHTGDTIMLKECITALNLSDYSKTEQVTEYISILQNYLEEIRNYLPVSQRIDGVWVSSLSLKDVCLDDIYFTPRFVLNINHDRIKLDNVGYGKRIADITFWKEKIINDESTYPQGVIDVGKNKVYIVWSSEKLKIPNQAVALSLAQTGSDITTNVVREGTSSVIGDIGGDLVGGIAGNIIGGAIADLFAPSKTIRVLEMELEKINDGELKGHYRFQTINVDSHGTPNTNIEEDYIYFAKYDIRSGAFFGSYGCKNKKYIPGYDISEEFPQEYAASFDSYVKRYPKKFSKMRPFHDYDVFGYHQLKKLIYYTRKQLIQQGYGQKDLYKEKRKIAEMGVYLENITGKEVKMPENISGVYVYDVFINRVDPWNVPAYILGIKPGDIILNIDGYEMDSPENLLQYIQSLNPYDWVKVHIKRGKKEIDIDVELTYKP